MINVSPMTLLGVLKSSAKLKVLTNFCLPLEATKESYSIPDRLNF